MPKFSVCIAADLRAYGDVEIEAATEEEALRIGKEIAQAGWKDKRMPTFNPEYDTLEDFEVIFVQPAGDAAA